MSRCHCSSIQHLIFGYTNRKKKRGRRIKRGEGGDREEEEGRSRKTRKTMKMRFTKIRGRTMKKSRSRGGGGREEKGYEEVEEE